MGSGEVVRYLSTYGSARVSKAALFGAVPPFLLKTNDNPEGVEGEVFEEVKAAIAKDRYAFFKDFFDNFFNVDELAPERISEHAWQASFNVAVGASPYATYAVVDSWPTDFRGDLPKIDVPTLVVHGTEDRVLPIAATERLPGLYRRPGARQVEGGPHNIAWTHPDEVNEALLRFLGQDGSPARPSGPAGRLPSAATGRVTVAGPRCRGPEGWRRTVRGKERDYQKSPNRTEDSSWTSSVPACWTRMGAWRTGKGSPSSRARVTRRLPARPPDRVA